MDRERLENLVSDYLDGALTPEDTAELFAELHDSSEARRYLLAAAESELVVHDLATSDSLPAPARQPAGRRTRRFRTSPRPGPGGALAGVAAAACFGLILVAAVHFWKAKAPAPTAAAPRADARPSSPPPDVERAREEVRRLEVERRKVEVSRETAERDRKDEELRAAEADLARIAAEHRAAAARLADAEALQRRNREAQPPPPAHPPKSSTQAAVARIRRTEGTVQLLSADGGKAPARPGHDLLAGQGLATVGPKSSAVVEFGDGSRVELSGDTEIRELGGLDAAGQGARGKRLRIARGTVSAEVARQPADRPMTFTTSQGEAVVLGTTLRIVLDADSTWLGVTEGKVRLIRLDGKVVDVPSGHFAVAAPGIDFVAKSMFDEILLLPRDAHLTTHWKVVEDNRASTGVVLEPLDGPKYFDSTPRIKAQTLGYVEFTFTADAHKEYRVWVRGCSPRPQAYEAVGFHFLQAQVGPLDPELVKATGLPLARFSGYTPLRQRYGWVGSGSRPEAGSKESAPVTVRFTQPGLQKLRLYPIDTPFRIDAVWLSATRKSRPQPDDLGPRPLGK